MYQRSFLDSFRLAIHGLRFIIMNERNMKVHFFFAFCALASSVFFRIHPIEFIFVVFSIALVMITEAANTAFELLLDFVHGDAFHPDVKLLKDIAAGGVFIAATNAFIVGTVIFIPRYICLMRSLFDSVLH